MKEKIVKRFYCDFCRKSGASKFHMANHESRCTLNPERKCRFCDTLSGGKADSVAAHIALLGNGTPAEMRALSEAVADCPACILAAIRQSGIGQRPGTGFPPEPGSWEEFDFKVACEKIWPVMNEIRNEGIGGYGGY